KDESSCSQCTMSALKLVTTGLVLVTIHRHPLQSDAFHFENLLTGRMTNQSRPKCYQDGFQIWREAVEIRGTFDRHNTLGYLVPLIFFWTTPNATKRNHICVMNFNTDDRQSVGRTCSWHRKGDVTYEYTIKVVASPDLNKTHIAFKPRVKGAAWEYTSELISIHPDPEFTIHFNGQNADPKSCIFHVAVGREFNVEFCAGNLKSPSVSVSWVYEPMMPRQDMCVTRTLSLSLGWDQLMLSYQDVCENVGAVICDVVDVNSPSNFTGMAHLMHTVTTTTAPPAEMSWVVYLIMPLTILSFFLLAGVTYALYKFCGSRKQSEILEPLSAISKHSARQMSTTSMGKVKSSARLSDRHKSVTSMGREASSSRLPDKQKSSTSLRRIQSDISLCDTTDDTTDVLRCLGGEMYCRAFYFNQILHGDPIYQSHPGCYQDGYQTWRESVTVIGTFDKYHDSEPLVPLEVFWKSTSSTWRNLICVLNFTSDRIYNIGPMCSWRKMNAVTYNYSIQLVAVPELHNTKIAFRPSETNIKGGYSSDTIFIHLFHVRQRKTEITGHSVQRKTEITGHSVQRKTEITGHSVQRKTEITGHSAQRKTEITGHSAQGKTEITGHSVQRKTEITGYSVQPDPVFNIRFNGQPANVKNCTFQSPIGQEFVVDFCADNLKVPILEVSWVNEPSTPKTGSCTSRTVSLAIVWDQLMLSYQDECDNVGVVVCDVRNGTLLHSSSTEMTTSTVILPKKVGWFSVIRNQFIILAAFCILMGVAYALYRCNRPKKVARTLIQQKQSSHQIASKQKSAASLGKVKSQPFLFRSDLSLS
ncbi:hypothetical protein Btru_071722, partial [Bulinus truncatus]